MARRKSQPSDSLNPFEGKSGFYNKINRLIYSYTGPAQVGIGRPEAPYVPPADPRCPLCGQSMSIHDIDRSGERTQLYCPPIGVSGDQSESVGTQVPNQ